MRSQSVVCQEDVGNASQEQFPQELVRFRPFCSDKDRAHVFGILKGQIRFSPLQYFNDPFEGKPKAVPAFSEVGKQRYALEKYFREIAKRGGKRRKEADAIATRFLASDSIEEIVRRVGELMRNTLTDQGVRLLCTSSVDALSSPLTWAHYGDSHRGVAIHFAANRPPFLFAQKVTYTDRYPEIVVPRTHQDPWDALQAALLTKALAWKEEREYRVIKVEKDLAIPRDPRVVDLGVQWQGDFASFDPCAVIAVTIGMRMPEADRAILIDWLREHRKDIRVFAAKLHDSQYVVETEELI